MNVDENDNQLSLIEACERCEIEKVNAILQSNPALAASRPTRGEIRTALQSATKTGCLRAVELLLARGSKEIVNWQDEYGWSALHLATVGAHHEIVSMLCSAGADPNILFKEGTTPLMFAAQSAKGKKSVEILIANGASVNSACSKQKWTPLHHAAQFNKKCRPIVEVLLRNGASRSAKDVDGYTPYDLAKALNKNDVLELLDPNCTTPIKFDAVGDDSVEIPPFSRIPGETDASFYSRKWKAQRCEEALFWLYENLVDVDGGIRTKEQVLRVFGPPDPKDSDAIWNYVVDADANFMLVWSPPGFTELEGWHRP